MFKHFRTVAFSALIAGSALLGLQAEEAKAQSRELWMYDNQTATVSGYFLAGESIYGACDIDCSDMDLFLYDGSSLISEDSLGDDFPIVTAPYEGYFTLQVSMYSCHHVQGCAVAIDSDHGF